MKRAYHLASKCPFCGRDEEDLEHILIHCPLIWGLWATLFSTIGVNWACPFLVEDLLRSWARLLVRKNVRILWMTATLSLLWAIWKERNIIVFEDAFFLKNRLKLSFISSLFSWAGLISNVDHSIVSVILCILTSDSRI